MADSANIVDLILAKPLESLPYEEKLRIKQQGRSTPKIDLVQKIGKSNRSFQLSWYDKVSWLTGSAVKKKMYCWPCLLMKPSHGCVVWSKLGFGDLSNFDRAYKRHENSNEHVSACARLSCMGRIRVEHAINEGARIQVAKHNETVKQNRAFLNRLIDVTSLLGRQELSFRGHDESSESSNKGNYREFTETLAKYDSVLSTQFESTVFSGMSDTIQNDLISALAATISDQIRDEIQDAPFFGWQVDETTDISCRAQLSVIVRYVDSAGKIQERFIGFFDVSGGRDAQSVFDVLNENMQGYNFKDKLVAQTYDGAAVMASALNGLGQSESNSPQCNVCALLCTQTESGAVTGGQMLAWVQNFFCITLWVCHIFLKIHKEDVFSGVCRLLKVAQKRSYSMEFHITDSEHCGKQLWWPPADIW